MARRNLPIKPHKRSSGQFVIVLFAMLRHPNFRRLSADAVRVWLEMHWLITAAIMARLVFRFKMLWIVCTAAQERLRKLSMN